MRRVLYINIDLEEKYKKILKELFSQIAKKEEYCFLRWKGGDTTDKAHLTLVFGIDENEKGQIENDEKFLELQNSRFEFRGLGLQIFNLKPCKACVLKVGIPKKLIEFREHIIKNYKINDARAHSFVPHITLGYLKQEFNLQNSKKLNIPDKIFANKMEVKIFGPKK